MRELIRNYFFELVFSAILLISFIIGLQNYLLFHGLVEIFSIAVAWSIFFLAWNTSKRMDNNYLLFVGVGYFFIGLIDLLHTMSYKGVNVFPAYGSNLSIELWIAARYMESLTLVVAPLLFNKTLRPTRVLAGFIVFSGLLLAAIFTGYFPDCFIDGQGLTPFKKTSEYIISVLLLAAGILLYRNRHRFSYNVSRLLLTSIALTICGELTFTLYVTLFSLPNLIGHVFKAASFFLIYKALLETGISKPFELVFRNLVQSREELRKSEERYRMIFENTPVGIIHMDADGIITDCNDRFVELMGSERERLIGFNTLKQIQNTEILSAVSAALQGKRQDYEGEYTSVTGHRTIPLRMVFNPIVGEDGTLGGLIATTEDITERKKAEALREDVDRMTRHDLKSPLNGIIGLPQVMMDDENLTDHQRETLKLIMESGYRMLAMINNSLELFKMETGRYRMKPSPVNLLDIVERAAVELTGMSEGQDKVQILLNDEPITVQDSFVVQGEELLLYTMTTNLLKNALEAGNGTPVTIRFEKDPGLTMFIHNSGLVPDELYHTFFDKYSTAGKNGIGLGTYSAKLIAEVHEAEIGFTSAPETGTTVYIRFTR